MCLREIERYTQVRMLCNVRYNKIDKHGEQILIYSRYDPDYLFL